MVISLFRDKLNEALYLVELVEKSCKAVEKKEKGRKRKERKTEGFCFKRNSLWFSNHFPSFFLELSSVES